MNIGMVWKGSATFKNDRNRSTDLALWKPLLDIANVTWHVLQTEATDAEIALLAKHDTVSRRPTPVKDWADTAAVITLLDLVITVDTGVAHLTGSLNKPVWILLPAVPDPRWLLNRDDSVWYSSARLFRQKAAGDWQDVFARVRDELMDMAGPQWPMQGTVTGVSRKGGSYAR